MGWRIKLLSCPQSRQIGDVSPSPKTYTVADAQNVSNHVDYREVFENEKQLVRTYWGTL